MGLLHLVNKLDIINDDKLVLTKNTFTITMLNLDSVANKIYWNSIRLIWQETLYSKGSNFQFIQSPLQGAWKQLFVGPQMRIKITGSANLYIYF